MISDEPKILDLNSADDIRLWANSAEHLGGGIHVLNGTHEVCDLMMGVVTGAMFWWPGQEATCLTEIVNYPRIRCASMFFCAGKMPEIEEWMRAGCALDQWAKEQECSRVQFIAVRKGWFRTVDGLTETGTIGHRSLK